MANRKELGNQRRSCPLPNNPALNPARFVCDYCNIIDIPTDQMCHVLTKNNNINLKLIATFYPVRFQ